MAPSPVGWMSAGQLTETGQKVPGRQVLLAGLCPTSETCTLGIQGLHLEVRTVPRCIHATVSDHFLYKMK